MTRILLRNCSYILARPDEPVRPGGSILIEDGLIAEVGEASGKDDIVVDCEGGLAMPALVNMHTHAAMTLFRGYSEDKPLMEWLFDIWSVEAKLKPWHVRAGTLVAGIEMALSGISTAMDMYFHTAEAARALEDVGIRGYLAIGLFDFMREDETERQLKIAEEHVRTIRNAGFELAKPALGPHAIYTCSRSLLEGVKELSERYNLLVHMHLAETTESQRKSLELYGMREAEILNEIGLLSTRSSFAHGVYLSEREIGLLAGAGSTIVHNPVSNMKLATGGISPLRSLIDAGVNVTLGTDGPGSGNRLDVFEAAKLAALAQRHLLRNAAALRVSEVLRMATTNGYRALGLKGGVLEPGYVADVLVVDLKAPNMWPPRPERLPSNLVYSASPSNVKTLVVNGRLVVDEGRILTVDVEKVYEGFERAVMDLFSEHVE